MPRNPKNFAVESLDGKFTKLVDEALIVNHAPQTDCLPHH